MTCQGELRQPGNIGFESQLKHVRRPREGEMTRSGIATADAENKSTPFDVHLAKRIASFGVDGRFLVVTPGRP